VPVVPLDLVSLLRCSLLRCRSSGHAGCKPGHPRPANGLCPTAASLAPAGAPSRGRGRGGRADGVAPSPSTASKRTGAPPPRQHHVAAAADSRRSARPGRERRGRAARPGVAAAQGARRRRASAAAAAAAARLTRSYPSPSPYSLPATEDGVAGSERPPPPPPPPPTPPPRPPPRCTLGLGVAPVPPVPLLPPSEGVPHIPPGVPSASRCRRWIFTCAARISSGSPPRSATSVTPFAKEQTLRPGFHSTSLHK
jgi:hypothetical protein